MTRQSYNCGWQPNRILNTRVNLGVETMHTRMLINWTSFQNMLFVALFYNEI
jgi:hypothetical protein